MPAWLQWVFAAGSFVGSAASVLGAAYAPDLRGWRVPLLLLAVGLLAVGLVFAGLALRQSPIAPWIRKKAWELRQHQSITSIDFLEVSRSDAQRHAKRTEQANRLRSAAGLVINEANEIAKLQVRYQESEKDAPFIAAARKQHKALEETERLKRLHFYLHTYHAALVDLDMPDRQIHESIYERLRKAEVWSELREPIVELYELLFQRGR